MMFGPRYQLSFVGGVLLLFQFLIGTKPLNTENRGKNSTQNRNGACVNEINIKGFMEVAFIMAAIISSAICGVTGLEIYNAG